MSRTKEYEDYISSDAWRARKIAYYSKHPKVCAACNSTENIHLHHHTYVRLTRELDSDLTPLCEPCHVAVHKYHARFPRKTLAKATREVIAHKRTPRKNRVRAITRNGKRSMSPSTKKLIGTLRATGHSDPVNAALTVVRERRRLKLIDQGFDQPIK